MKVGITSYHYTTIIVLIYILFSFWPSSLEYFHIYLNNHCLLYLTFRFPVHSIMINFHQSSCQLFLSISNHIWKYMSKQCIAIITLWLKTLRSVPSMEPKRKLPIHLWASLYNTTYCTRVSSSTSWSSLHLE